MKNLIVWFNSIINKHKALKRWRRVVTVLAAIMTFVTTYALILPAITVEKNKVEDVGGMYLEQEADTNDMFEENALEPIGVSIAAEHENAVTFAYTDDSMTATAVFGTNDEIPAGAELVVTPIEPESVEYTSLRGRSAELLDKEFIYDVTTCSFYDFALVLDDIDVTPKTGLVDIQIIFHDNTVEHLDDTFFAGRFARQADDSSDVKDELVSVNPDESSVIELTDGIITALSLKGNDLSETDSLVGILAGNVDEEIKAAAAETDAEIPDSEDAQEESAQSDSAGTDGEEAAPKVGTLKASGSDYTVTLTYDATAEIPEGASLTVSEIAQNSKEYKKYLEETKKAMGLTEEETLPQYAARFFDIKIMVGGDEFVPESGVTVEIAYTEPLAANPETEVNAVHFHNDTTEPEVIGANVTEISSDGTSNVEFTAEAFSVYGVVYTVDFEYSVNGKMYQFSLPGGGFVSFTDLVEVLGIIGDTNSGENGDENGSVIAENAEENTINEGAEENGVNSDTNTPLTLGDVEVSEATRKFVENVASVEFSSPELVDVSKVDADTTVGQIKESRGLECQYSAELTEAQIAEINAQTVEAGDWALISVQPFTSEETLTVTMKNGEVFTVKVTDAQSDAIHNSDGTVQTISNPQGTSLELFNYYVDYDRRTTPKRDQWPGHVHGEEFKFNWYDRNGNLYKSFDEGYDECKDSEDYLLGYGNNRGINKNHVFKFSPANAGTVIDGTKNTKTKDVNDGSGLNGWTQDADPNQGIVEGTLHNGYPKLTKDDALGTDGESLAYLFDGTAQEGKESKGAVNHLLYVDPDGYYTYDSRDFKAYIQNDGNFVVSNQPDTTDTELKGFWPFGDQIFWSGLHMKTQFSMPENGQVLNPKGEYKDMQFEFSGDDDTWLYIDGVLVGDGGGIHNRTEIDINFADGTVTITGKKDTVHTGTFEETRYLDDIFREAGRYNDGEWEDIGDGSGHKRLKAGTYHTFDMFYLERGGGESNLYIHYNLISTADFTGHKAYEGFGESGRMARDQFQFEMIGLEGRYESVPDGVDENGKTKYKLIETGWTNGTGSLEENKSAIMPVAGTPDGAGTVASPRKVSGQVTVGNEQLNAIIYTTGVSEDGNINFGSADINSTEQDALADGHGSVYKYIIREVVPPDAVNNDGITWAAATEEQKKAGGFVKDQVTYDGTIYYMTAGVTSWQQAGADGTPYTAYGLRKIYYTDETYTTVADDTNFVSFINTKVGMKFGRVDFTKTDALGNPLEGAEFTLYKEVECTTVETNRSGKRMAVTSGVDGVISFENMPLGTYYMKETKAPEGYALDDTVYKVIIADPDSPSGSRIVVNGDETETPVTEITNGKPGELTVVKKWQDQNGESTSGVGKIATIHLNRRHFVDTTIAENHNVSFEMGVRKYQYNGDTSEWTQPTTQEVSGDKVVIKWYDSWNNNFNYTIMVGNTILANNAYGGNSLSGSNYSISNIDENNKSRQLIITGVDGDVYVKITHHENWLHNNEHWWKITNGATIIGEGGTSHHTLVEDIAFNSSNDPDRTRTLSYPNITTTWQLGSEKFPLKDEEGKDWLYYITEDPSSDFELVGYSSNNNPGVADHGVIEVTNRVQVPPNGSLRITKAVTINGDAPSNVEADLKDKADGTYTFEIWNADGSQKVTQKADGSEIGTLSINIINGVADKSITVDCLTPGFYVIKETGSTNTKTLIDTTVVGYDTNKGGISVEVTAGDTTGVKTAAFTNKYSETSITVKKIDSNKSGDGRFIAGAKFSLYKVDSTDVLITDPLIKKTGSEETISLDSDNRFTIPIEGITIFGLQNGSYKMVEREAPAGYVIINNTISFTVGDGQVTAWSLAGTPDTTMEIPNTPGAALPSTGGPGTRFFTILGSILILGAGVLLWRRRRLI